MSTEQEISGAEREAREAAWDKYVPEDLVNALSEDGLVEGFDIGWRAARDYYEKRHVEQQAKVLEVEFEQRQRADMAEEREKKLREGFRRSAERMHSLSEDPEHMGHVFNDCPHYACFEARGTLDA